MKVLTYVRRLEYNRGTEDEPVIVEEIRREQIGPFEDSRLDEQMEEALKYAYDGEVFVEDAGADPEPEPSPEEQLRADVDFLAAMQGVSL